MPHSAARGAAQILGLVLAVASCRSVLDITPGRPLESDGGSAGKSSGGKTSSTMGGSDETGGASEPGVGGSEPGVGGSTAGKGSGGSAKGGDGLGGTSDTGGDGAGGDGVNTPVSPFPAGACRDCIERNCPVQAEECSDDADCASGIPAWLSCSNADANECVSPDAGLLRTLELCGAESCDLCRHQTDGEPTLEILTPSNGAQVVVDALGRFEMTVRVHNITVKSLGQCGTDVACGHVHLNLDLPNCRKTGFYNEWIVSTQPDGTRDAIIDTTYCTTQPVFDRDVVLTASLSDYQTHADRIPLVQSSVHITVKQ